MSIELELAIDDGMAAKWVVYGCPGEDASFRLRAVGGLKFRRGGFCVISRVSKDHLLHGEKSSPMPSVFAAD